MSILKNVIIDNVPDVTTINFGTGDILVSTGSTKNETFIALTNIEPHPIGSDAKEYEDKNTIEELKPEAVIYFTNQKSIDVMIRALIVSKNNLFRITQMDRPC